MPEAGRLAEGQPRRDASAGWAREAAAAAAAAAAASAHLGLELVEPFVGCRGLAAHCLRCRRCRRQLFDQLFDRLLVLVQPLLSG